MGRHFINRLMAKTSFMALAGFLTLALVGPPALAGNDKCGPLDYSISLIGSGTCSMDGGLSTVALYSAEAVDPTCKDISNVTLSYSDATLSAVDPTMTGLYSIGSSGVDVNFDSYNKSVSAGLNGVKIDASYDTTDFDFALVFGSEVDVTLIDGSVKAGPTAGIAELDERGDADGRVDIGTNILGGEVRAVETDADGNVTQTRLSTGLRVNNASDDEAGFTAYVRHPADAEFEDTAGYIVTPIDSVTTRIDGSLSGGDSATVTIVGNSGDFVELFAVPSTAAEINPCDNFISGTIEVAGENSLSLTPSGGTPTLIEINDGESLTLSYDLNNFSLVAQDVNFTLSVTGVTGSVTLDAAPTVTFNGVAITCIPSYDPTNDPNTGSLLCQGLTLEAGSRNVITVSTDGSVNVTSAETAVGIFTATVESNLATAEATAIEVRVEPVERVAITLDGPTEVFTVSGGTVATSYGIVNNTADTLAVTLNVSQEGIGTLNNNIDPVLTVEGNVVAGTITMPSDDVRVATYTFDIPPTPNTPIAVTFEANYENDYTDREAVIVVSATLDAGGGDVREAEVTTVTVAAAPTLESDSEQELTFASGEEAEIRIDVRNNSEQDEEVTFVVTASAGNGEIRTEDEDPVVTVTYEDGSSLTLACQSQDPNPGTGVLACESFTMATDSTASVTVTTTFFNLSTQTEATGTVTAEFITANGEAADPLEILIVVEPATDVITFFTDQTNFDLASGDLFVWDIRVDNNSTSDFDGTFTAYASPSEGDIRSETDGQIVATYADGTSIVLACVNQDPNQNDGLLLCPLFLPAGQSVDLEASAVFLNQSSTETATFTIETSYVLADGTVFVGPTATGTVAPADINDLINITAVNVPPATVTSGDDVSATFALYISSQFANDIGDLVFTIALESGINISQGVLVLDETGNEWSDDAGNVCVVTGLTDRQNGDGLVSVTCPVAGTQDGAAPTLSLFGVTNNRLDDTNGSVVIDASVTLANVTALLDAPIEFAVESGAQRQ